MTTDGQKDFLDWTPRIGRKNKGRPRVQWEDDIRKFWAKEPRSIWRRESNNRTKWRAHAEAFDLQWARFRLTMTMTMNFLVVIVLSSFVDTSVFYIIALILPNTECISYNVIIINFL